MPVLFGRVIITYAIGLIRACMPSLLSRFSRRLEGASQLTAWVSQISRKLVGEWRRLRRTSVIPWEAMSSWRPVISLPRLVFPCLHQASGRV